MRSTPVQTARRLTTAGVVAALSTALLPACTPQHQTETQPALAEAPVSTITFATSSAGPAPVVAGAKSGGTVTVLMEGDEFEHIDPGRSYTPDAQLANLLIQRTLTAYRRVGPGSVELVGDLATDTGRPSADLRTWTYTLRSGLKYEDGTPITSADIAYAVARSFSPVVKDGPSWLQEWLAGRSDFGKAYTGPYNGGRPSAPGVTTPDAKTIVFHFPKPQRDMPYVGTMGNTTPVPRAKDKPVAYDTHPIATGPYRIATYDKGAKMELVRNRFWDANSDPVRHAYLDGVTFQFGQTADTATQRLLHENAADATAISGSMVPAEAVPQVLADHDVSARASYGVTPYVGFLKINTERVTDLTVRQALNCAFDREGYVKLLGGSSIADPSTTIQPRVIAGFQDFNAYPCGPNGDPAKARKMLGGTKPTLRYGFRQKASGQKQYAFMREKLGKAGFTVVGVPINGDHYFDTLSARHNGLDIYMSTWSSDWPASEAMLPPLLDGRTIRSGGTNTSFFNDPAVNAEIDRIRTLSTQEAPKAWSALEQKVMRESAPLVPVFYDKTFKLNGSRVGGLYLDGVLGGTSLVNAYVK